MSEPTDEKKPLLKRKKGTASNGAAEKPFHFGDSVDSAASKKFKDGHGTIRPSDFFQLPGISLDGMFALQFVLGADVIPFNREISIQGAPGDGKSLIAWFIAKIFLDNSGFVGVVETESKTSPEQVRAVLQRTDEEMDMSATIIKAKTTEAMLAKIGFLMEFFRDNVPRQYPCLLIVDSFSNPTSEKIKEKVIKDGVASMGFDDAKKAAMITNTSKATDAVLDSGPFVKILIHHEKTALGDDDSKWGGSFGGPQTTTSGGIHHRYKSSITLQVTKGARKDSITDGARTVHYLKGVKMAVGQDNRKVPIVVHDRMITPPIEDIPEGEDPIDHRYQLIDIDWGHSLMLILKGIYEDNYAYKGKISKTEVKNITGVAISGNSAWCTRIGIKEADKISFSEMGAILQADKGVISKLQKIMHIDHHKAWEEVVAKHKEDPKNNPLPYMEPNTTAPKRRAPSVKVE